MQNNLFLFTVTIHIIEKIFGNKKGIYYLLKQ